MLSSAAHPLKHRQGNSVMEQDGYKKHTNNNNKTQQEERIQGERRGSAHALSSRGRLFSFPSSL